MGFGAEVAAVLQYQAFDWLDAPVERVGARFTPLPFAPVMEKFVVPHAADVLAAIYRTVNKTGLMATEVILPRLGQGMESGTIVRWLKAEGDAVEKGEPLFELDTDKVTQEVEAEASGVLLRIAVAEGEVPVGRTVAFIGDAGESVAEAAGSRRPRRAPAAEAPAADAGPRAAGGRREHASTEFRAAIANGRVKASPLARRIARERGVDLRQLQGTGPEGRIVAEDVERAGAAPAPAAAAAARRRRPARSSGGRSRTSARRSRAGSRRPGRCPRSCSPSRST